MTPTARRLWILLAIFAIVSLFVSSPGTAAAAYASINADPKPTPDEGKPSVPELPIPGNEENGDAASQGDNLSADISGQKPVYLAVVRKQVTPVRAPEKVRFCSNPKATIPDGNTFGLRSTINAQDPRVVLDMDVLLDIPHAWVGDLVVTLNHAPGGKSITLINRPGLPARDKGCRIDNIFTILDDSAPWTVESACDYTGNYEDDINPKAYDPYSWGVGYSPAISAVRSPEQPLKALRGEPFSGAWTLAVYDQSSYDTGQLRNWCLDVTLGAPTQIPADTPPPSLPRSATVSNVPSHPQQMPLDCESAVAVDFAAFFGKYINEATFFYSLPTSDNPEQGFVGSVWGKWGQTPPYPYGVHPEPVAKVLRNYGVAAQANQNLSFTGLMQEIVAGRPVFVWIVDSIYPWTTPSLYWPQSGSPAMVANYQHVAMVVGYNEDTDKVTIRDNGKTYTASYGSFLRSWGAMGNQAITYNPTLAASLVAEAAPDAKLAAAAPAQWEAPPEGTELPVFGQGGYYYAPGEVVAEPPSE